MPAFLLQFRFQRICTVQSCSGLQKGSRLYRTEPGESGSREFPPKAPTKISGSVLFFPSSFLRQMQTACRPPGFQWWPSPHPDPVSTVPATAAQEGFLSQSRTKAPLFLQQILCFSMFLLFPYPIPPVYHYMRQFWKYESHWFDFSPFISYTIRYPNNMADAVMKQCMNADNLHRRLKKIIGQVQQLIVWWTKMYPVRMCCLWSTPRGLL